MTNRSETVQSPNDFYISVQMTSIYQYKLILLGKYYHASQMNSDLSPSEQKSQELENLVWSGGSSKDNSMTTIILL